MSALLLLLAAPSAFAQTTGQEAFGMLPELTGKTFTSGACTIEFKTAPDGRYKVAFCDFAWWLVGKNPDGSPQPRFHGNGTVTVDGTFEAGPSGLVFGSARFATRYYFLQDRNGNFDFVIATKKDEGMRLDAYSKAIDPTSPRAIAAGVGIASYTGKKNRAAVEQLLGYSLDDLPGKVKEPSPFTAAPVVASAPARPGTRPGGAAAPARTIGPRLALVIGNSAYGAAIGGLKNPVNDAHGVAIALKSAGFRVIAIDNADQRAMKRAMLDFGNQLRAFGRGGTGLFYFAGHGVQARGINYLVPTDAAIVTEADVEVEAVAADGILRQMEDAGIGTSIIILDACRNLPVQRAARDGTRGLARMDAPNGSFMAYSTAPGSVAADGAGLNSPFATALMGELRKPGQPIEQLFRNVRKAVIDSTGGKQVPWDSSSLLDSFVFTLTR